MHYLNDQIGFDLSVYLTAASLPHCETSSIVTCITRTYIFHSDKSLSQSLHTRMAEISWLPSPSTYAGSFYEDLYKSLHANPNLSTQESFASETVSHHLKSLNARNPGRFAIHQRIGGYGLAAVLRNGPGKTVLLRADMDALPVEETTGLPYASTKREVDRADNIEKPVMHACGHDVHVTCLLAVADALSADTSTWSGTLVLVFQPNEERGKGAQAMVDGGLYDKVPVPDMVLGQHVVASRAGQVKVRTGPFLSAAESFRITLFGRGAHGSMPNVSIDPVVLAANVVLRLQGIVSRETDPAEFAVLTVGTVQAGQTENIIPDKAVLGVDFRTFSKVTREKIFAALHRIVRAECQASGCTKEPLIEETRRFPVLTNDAGVTAEVGKSFAREFGGDFDPNHTRIPASEDVSVLAESVRKPCCFWTFGGTEAEEWDRAEKEGKLVEDIPVNHSSYFGPAMQPTLKTGTRAMYAAALTFLRKD